LQTAIIPAIPPPNRIKTSYRGDHNHVRPFYFSFSVVKKVARAVPAKEIISIFVPDELRIPNRL
jgi:hypothetical protein